MRPIGLTDLIAPMTPAAFLDQLRQREMFVQRAENPDRFRGLVDWPDLDALNALPEANIRVTRHTDPVRPFVYRDQAGLRPQPLQEILAAGASLVAGGLHVHLPAWRTLAQTLARETGESIALTAIVTQGEGGAFGLHYDPEDLLVLQLEGSKRWIIGASPVVNPVLKGLAQPKPDPGDVLTEITLDQGDVLFLPAGYWHRCENQSEVSRHVSLCFTPLSAVRAFDLASKRVRHLAEARVPVRPDQTLDVASAEALKAMMIEQIRDWPAEDLLRAHLNLPADRT